MSKLLKYELWAVGRLFLPIAAALLLVSLVARALGTLPPETFSSVFQVGRALSFLLVAGVAVFTLGITLQRFRRSLLGDEGYLMFMLPVSVDALILSKLVAALLMCLLGLLVAGFSVLLISMRDIGQALREVAGALPALLRGEEPEWLQFLLLAALAPVFGILLCYVCMALAMLAGNRRGLAAVGLFFATMTLMQLLGVALNSLMAGAGLFRGDADHVGYLRALLWAAIGLEGFFGAIFYFVTRYMLKNRLNLE
ncbi:MAG: hypothetical protein LBD02_10245 [Christensenellaceae bacterium]|jgi:hypothetical protein|nr:hypothetical protein [Christensenellaceae bacterium]